MKIFKKIILISIIILYLLTIITFADTGKINIEATRVRKEKNTTSEILTVIYKNEKVEILQTEGEWLKIKYKDYTGFVKKEFVDIQSEKNNSETNSNVKKENANNTVNTNQVSVYQNEDKTDNNSNEIYLNSKTNLRNLPNFMSKKTQELEQGTKLTILTKMNHWLKVTDGIVVGWITEVKTTSKEVVPTIDSSDLQSQDANSNKKETNATENNIENNTVNNTENNTVNTNKKESSSTTTSKKGKIKVETAKVRKEPSTSAGLIGFLDYGDEITITKESGDWYFVNHQDIEGFVNKSLVTIIEKEVSSRSLEQERNEKEVLNKEDNSKKAELNNTTVTEFAKQYLGYSYVSGGKTPNTGFDCSGFTQYIYKNFGITLSNTAASQVNAGSEVSREQLQPGDLILFYDEGKTKIGHTGIYLGNGDFIHAANPERGVVVDNLNTNTYYNQRYVMARRLV